ncbi:tRNA-modifying protein YgfZ [Vibrio rumoiensis]|uniref:tRNA-modifying protein YgfZ n=1 Tax=Vibrio rumoiensis 1S-45 TaxID=1188252 RepID=A0A1E5E593_9VIBR|nr:tRNA-modifying protein YgfZ [Vibrio rumoiensis]OEF27774.1 tRNA-modifying protein [Vibrio rumoiensis 1S-45]
MNLTKTFTALPISSTQDLPDLIICHLPSWGAITMVGDDKKSYLQGQITSNVVALEPNQSTLGAHCDGKGKMLSTFRLFHHNNGYAMFQHRSAIEKELVEIKKYAIFSKVEIQESTDVCLGVIGVHANTFIQKLASKSFNSEHTNQVVAINGGSAVQISTTRWLLLLTQESAEQILDTDTTASLANDAIWDYADILDAIPRISSEDQLEHIPQAMNLQALDGISFTKGCYTGQETVARAKYRGINKRAMFKLEGHSDSPLPSKTTIERQVGENWRGAGKLLAQYQFTDGKIIALAVLPNNLEPDTSFRFEDSPTTLLTFAELPYSLQE